MSSSLSYSTFSTTTDGEKPYRRKTTTATSHDTNNKFMITKPPKQSNTLKRYHAESPSSSSSFSSPPPSPYTGTDSTSLAYSPYLFSGALNEAVSSGDAEHNFKKLLKKITKMNLSDEDDGGSGESLANFEPLIHPQSGSKLYDQDDDDNDDNPFPPPPPPPLLPRAPLAIDNEANRNYLPNAEYQSNSNMLQSSAYTIQSRSGNENRVVVAHDDEGRRNDNSKILEKMNYMIFLLEDQQNQRTNNITEEFILYLFVGIFVIFMIDAFFKSARRR